jgi:homoserine O-acetyltransferase/O-succinyltransferase
MTRFPSLLLLPLAAACAQTAMPPAEGDFTLRDFRFASGETLAALRIHYTTLGAPARDAGGRVRNAVLILHGTGGSGRNFLTDNFAGVLFGKDQPLDASRCYLVLPDGIGHGQSSKPSDGLHARFPRYEYEDMVRAQYRLLREGLGVDHLRLVMGTSMGGMHTWMWGELYPDFMDALMPLASAPVEIAGRNRIFRRMIIDSIRGDPEWKNGEYAAPPRGLVAAQFALFMMTSSPLQLHQAAPTRDAADAEYERIRERALRADANDLLYAYEASRNYNPAPALHRIRAPLVAINSADDEVNPPELGILEREIRRVPNGRFVLIPTSGQTRGHGTHSQPVVWKQYLVDLLQATAR